MKNNKINLQALDWLNFFIANFQTGFSPFIAAYLATCKWSQTEIGMVLSIGTIIAMIIQIPGGAILDEIKNKKSVAACAISAIILSSLLLCLSQKIVSVIVAEVFYGFASCMLLPAIATLSLSLVGYAELGERLSRNTRWASIGSVVTSCMIGLFSEYFSVRAVFWLIAVLTLPALVALSTIQPTHTLTPESSTKSNIDCNSNWNNKNKKNKETLRELLHDRRMLIFSGCIILFYFSNAAMLNLVAGELTDKMRENVQLIIASCIAIPQSIVALLSVWIGYFARIWGRRPILLIGFFALPVRALLFSSVTSPHLLISVQMLDGISTAVLNVMLPLIAADITGRNGYYNLCIGLFGLSSCIGTILSTVIAGFVAEHFGISISFFGLGIIGILGVLLILLKMPETGIKD